MKTFRADNGKRVIEVEAVDIGCAALEILEELGWEIDEGGCEGQDTEEA